MGILLALLHGLFLMGLVRLTWKVWRGADTWRSLFALALATWLVGALTVFLALQTRDIAWLAQTHRWFAFERKAGASAGLAKRHTLIAPVVEERLPAEFARQTQAVAMRYAFLLQPDGTVGNVALISDTTQDGQLEALTAEAIRHWRFGPLSPDTVDRQAERVWVRIANRRSALLSFPALLAFALLYAGCWYMVVRLTPEEDGPRSVASAIPVELRRLTVVIGFLMGLGWLIVYRLAPATFEFSLPANMALWMLLGGGVLLAALYGMRGTEAPGVLVQRIGNGWAISGAALLVITHFCGVGHGSDIRLWLRIGPLEFETVELVKLMMVFYVTSVAYSKSRAGNTEVRHGEEQVRLVSATARYQGLVGAFCMVFCALALMSDFGPLLLLFLLLIALFQIQGFPRWAAASVGVLGALLAVAYLIGAPARWHDRVDSWRNPWVSAKGDSSGLQQGREHAAHALWAISSGGLLGSGLGRGFPDDVHEIVSDFVFTAIAEEMGWIGALTVVGLLAYLVYASLTLAEQRDDAVGRLLIGGIGALVGLQSLLILGGNIGLWPLTGIPLPLLSYGGTSLVINCFAFGLLLGAAARTDPFSPPLLGSSQDDSTRSITWLRLAIFPVLFAAVGVKLALLQLPFSPWRPLMETHVRADGTQANNPRFAAKAKPVLMPVRGAIRDCKQGVIAETLLAGGKRVLHAPQLYAPLVGLVSGQGTTVGMERCLGALLRGQMPGSGTPEEVAQGNRGFDVTLTVDPDLQRLAYGLLEAKGYSGSIVGIVPATGEIRFAVSRQEGKTAPADVPAWQEAYSGRMGAYPFCYRRLYAPGSTLKTLDAAAAMEYGLTAEQTTFTCLGEFALPGGRPIHDFERRKNPLFAGHGVCDLARALTYSCNSTFAHLGVELGWTRLYDYAERTGFDTALPLLPESLRGDRTQWLEATPSELTARAELPESLSAHEKSPIFLAQTALGQRNVRMTPLHLALWTAAIANGGCLMEPSLVAQIGARGLNPVWKHAVRTLGRAMSGETAARLRRMMAQVVDQGTGRNAKVRGLSIAGKTGSPQEDTGETNALFIGFAPVENPQMAVAIVVDGGKTGGSVAAPLAARLLAAAVRPPTPNSGGGDALLRTRH